MILFQMTDGVMADQVERAVKATRMTSLCPTQDDIQTGAKGSPLFY
jgi:hypothetical protein